MINIRLRSSILFRKLGGAFDGVGLVETVSLVTKTRSQLHRSVCLVERDVAAGLILCRVPPNKKPLWFPETSTELIDSDPFGLAFDHYHGAFIGDIPLKGRVVIDAGGYVGEFGMYCLNRGARQVVMFEPNGKSIECIKRNLGDAVRDGRVIVVEAGMSNEDGACAVFQMDVASGYTLNAAMVGNAGAEPATGESIPVRRLDSVVEECGIKTIGLIKMDIEGAERPAIEGAETALRTLAPHLAICTYHLPDDKTVIPEMVNTINPAYTVPSPASAWPIWIAGPEG